MINRLVTAGVNVLFKHVLTYFRFMPGHASRELLVIMGSLTTCDSQDVNCTIDVSHICHLNFNSLYIATKVSCYFSLTFTVLIMNSCYL
jgi:hypothetical protein